MKITRHIFIVIAMLLISFQMNAKIKLPALFTDNMMLQQKANAPIWGWSENNANVTIKTSWNSKIYKVKADASGKWKTALQTPSLVGHFRLKWLKELKKSLLKTF